MKKTVMSEHWIWLAEVPSYLVDLYEKNVLKGASIYKICSEWEETEAKRLYWPFVLVRKGFVYLFFFTALLMIALLVPFDPAAEFLKANQYSTLALGTVYVVYGSFQLFLERRDYRLNMKLRELDEVLLDFNYTLRNIGGAEIKSGSLTKEALRHRLISSAAAVKQMEKLIEGTIRDQIGRRTDLDVDGLHAMIEEVRKARERADKLWATIESIGIFEGHKKREFFG